LMKGSDVGSGRSERKSCGSRSQHRKKSRSSLKMLYFMFIKYFCLKAYFICISPFEIPVLNAIQSEKQSIIESIK